MPNYSWRCPNGTQFEQYAPFRYDGEHEPECPCCGVPAARDLYADLRSQLVVCDDPIRKAWLGSQIDRNLQAQGRPLDPLAPKDRFEARHVEKALGRVHVGNDVSGMRPISQRAIMNGERQRGQDRPVIN